MPDTSTISTGSDPVLAFRTARAESGLRRARQERLCWVGLLAAVFVSGVVRLWSAVDPDASRLRGLVDFTIPMCILWFVVMQALQRAGEREEADRATRLDRAQLCAMPFAKGEFVGHLACADGGPTALVLSFRPPMLLGWAGGLCMALFAATIAVKFANRDPTWFVEAVVLGLGLSYVLLMLFLLSRPGKFRSVKVISIEHAGAPDARVTVTPMNPRQGTLTLRRGDLDRVRLEVHGPANRKQLVIAGPAGSSGTELATLSVTASSNADDLSVERLHQAITAALA